MPGGTGQHGDKLLWLAAGVVALMSLAWFLIEPPWQQEPTDDPAQARAVSPARAVATDSARDGRASPAAATTASGSLRMARMALDAGMLLEPPEYSAWTLYGNLAASDPGDVAVNEGLAQVADALLARGNAALEQGRYDDASEIASTILARLADHDGARDLEARIDIGTAPPPVAVPDPPAPVASTEPAVPVDPIPVLHRVFGDAMAQNAVLRPAGSSAIDVVREMLAMAPDHALTVAARELLVTEMLDRSVQSIEALDPAAAQTWVDSAATLAGNTGRIETARDRLNAYLIETESNKLLPASALTRLDGAAPEFPPSALERGIEGWVEIEFVVAPDGHTEDIGVLDASHKQTFHQEAIAAVGGWRFEPFVFMDQPIPKRAYARLQFVID
jgi:TonB family protein